MAVDLLSYARIEEQVAIQEAGAAGLRSMEHLIHRLSDHRSLQQLDCRDIADVTVSKFKKFISVLNRTGHARFRRGPTASPPPPAEPEPEPVASVAKTLALTPVPLRNKPPGHPLLPVPVPSQAQARTALDFTKLTPASASETSPPSRFNKEYLSISTPISPATPSFVSSVTGDGSLSNGRFGAASSLLPPPVSAGKLPIVSAAVDRRCHDHAHAHSEHAVGKCGVPGARCHCSKRR